MDQAFRRYEQYQHDKGNKPGSTAHNMWRLRVWIDDNAMMDDITKEIMEAKYRQRCETTAVDTHRGELAVCKTFWRWSVDDKIIEISPAEHIRPIGRRRRGKKQLRKGEAQRFAGKALLTAQAGDDGALGALTVLMLGIRSGELRKRKVRNLDATTNEVLFWIEDGKTQAAERHPGVPQPLASLLLEHAGDRGPEEWLFAANNERGYRSATWLRKSVKRVCAAAGVPNVCPHGLRGTWATLTTDAGLGAHVVARELGHTNPAVTRDHYTATGADDRARIRRLELFKRSEGA